MSTQWSCQHECLHKAECCAGTYLSGLLNCTYTWVLSTHESCQHERVCIKLSAVQALTLVVCWTVPPCWSCQHNGHVNMSVCIKLSAVQALTLVVCWTAPPHGSCQHVGHVNMRESAWRSVCCACSYLSGAVQLHLHIGHVHVNVSEGHRTSQLHAACREQLLQHSKQCTVSRSIWEHACMCAIYTKSTFNWLLTLSQPLKCHLMWFVNVSPSAYRMVINFLLEFQHLMNSYMQQSYEMQ